MLISCCLICSLGWMEKHDISIIFDDLTSFIKWVYKNFKEWGMLLNEEH